MKFLIDAQLPPALCLWLSERGHEAEHVSEIGLLTASDAAIVERAEAADEVLVSKDEDFVVLRMPDRFALLWLRCGNATNAALAVWLEGEVGADRPTTGGRRKVCGSALSASIQIGANVC